MLNALREPSLEINGCKKGGCIYEAICEHQSVNIRHISQDWAEQMGYYRFLGNEQVSVSELVRSLASH
ncbi:hypothetical protein, partial [Thermoleptolyngbya sp.]